MNDRPKRVQMSRQRPWRQDHPDAVIVARPSRWGNWYRVTTLRKRYEGNQRYLDALPDPDAWIVEHVDKRGMRTGAQWGGFADRAEAVAFAVDLHARSMRATRLDLDGIHHHEHYLSELRGKDLACWCPLDQPCHADVLLELANMEDPS